MPFLFFMDPTGIEPVSENPSPQLSPQTVLLLELRFYRAEERARQSRSRFMRDGYNDKLTVHVHRSMTLFIRPRSSGQERAAIYSAAARLLRRLLIQYQRLILRFEPFYGFAQPAALIASQNPRRNLYGPL